MVCLDYHNKGDMMTDLQIAWIAGWLEGEGYFALRGTRKQYATVVVDSVDEDTIRKAHTLTGVGNVYGPYTRKNPGNKQPLWKWAITAHGDAISLMEQVLPHMSSRRARQIRAVLQRPTQLAPTQGS